MNLISSKQNLKVIGLFFILVFITRFITLLHPVFNGDETNYVAHALIMKQGGVPYVDFVEKKPPLIYMFYTLSLILFGTSLIAVHTLTLFVVLGSALGLKRLFEVFEMPSHGMWAGVLYIIFSASFRESEVFATNCEILMNLPIIWALVYLARSLISSKKTLVFAFLCGLFCSLAFLFKHQAGIILVICFFAIWQFHHNFKIAFINLIIGFLLPIISLVLFYFQIGHLKELYEWMVEFNFVYVNTQIPLKLILQKGFINTFGFIAANFFLCYFIWNDLKSKQQNSNILNKKILKNIATVGLIASFLPVIMGWRFYGHYYIQLYPFLVILATFGVTHFIKTWSQKTKMQRTVFCISALLSFLIFQGVGWWGIKNEGFEGAKKFHEPLTQEIQKLSISNDKIFVWGNYAYAYALANRIPASRFVICEYIVPYWDVNFKSDLEFSAQDIKPIEAEQFKLMMTDLLHNQPKLILDTSTSFHFKNFSPFQIEKFLELKNFIKANYTQISTVEGVTFYQRNTNENPVLLR